MRRSEGEKRGGLFNIVNMKIYLDIEIPHLIRLIIISYKIYYENKE